MCGEAGTVGADGGIEARFVHGRLDRAEPVANPTVFDQMRWGNHMKKHLVLSLVVAMLAIIGMPAQASSSVTVTGSGQSGWTFNPDPNYSTPYTFTRAEASIGSGSLYVEPIGSSANDKFIAAKVLGIGAEELLAVSYDFLITGGGTESDADDFYLNIYTNLPGSSTFYDCRFDYVPASGSLSAFTTAGFAATDAATNVADRPDGYTCPGAIDGLAEGSTVSAIVLNVGQSTASDTGLAGYLDNVQIATTSGTTVYDFERAPQTLAVDDGTECPDAEFSTIQEALDAAEPFDTVLVCPGTYTGTVTINTDDVILTSAEVASLGENTIIQALPDITTRPDVTAITVEGDRVTLSGLRVRNARFGILSNGDEVEISHNHVHGAYNNAVVSHGRQVSVVHNLLTATNYGVSAYGWGNTLAHNVVTSGSQAGIRLNRHADDSTVAHNQVCGSAGIWLISGTTGVNVHHNVGEVRDEGTQNKDFKNDSCS